MSVASKVSQFVNVRLAGCSSINVSKDKLFVGQFCMHVLATQLTCEEGTTVKDTI